MNTKIIVLAVIGVALIIGVMYYPVSEETPKGSEETLEVPEKQVGVVEGVVYFVGKPCPPSKVGPPCDGPYPNYEVIIYEDDGKSIVDKIMTDDQGNFEIQLSVGDYLVFGKNLDFNKVKEIPIMFTIEPDKRKNIEILINQGIR